MYMYYLVCTNSGVFLYHQACFHAMLELHDFYLSREPFRLSRDH